MYRLYEFSFSGNCYKIRLLLSQLKILFERVEIDIVKGESRTPQFLKMNPNGRVPVLQVNDQTFLSESNAILWFLAEGTSFLPSDTLTRAQVLQWMFFEQYSHEPNIATSRYWISILKRENDKEYIEILRKKKEAGYAALTVMETHLSRNNFFAANKYTVADIALYAYTHVAHEGGFDLKTFPYLLNWLDRVKQQPGHITILD